MLLDAYRTEFETTDITLDALLRKYSLTPSKLKGCKTWTKASKQTVDTTDNIEVLPPAQPPQTYKVVPPKPATIETELTTLDKITKFKELAIDRALKFINEEAQFADVKEFKDIVAIVDSIEKSYQKVDPEAGKPTVNVFIQNLMQQFKDDV